MAQEKRNKYIVKIMSMLLCIPVVLTLLVAIIRPIRENMVRDSFAEQLYNYKLPENTTIVEKYGLCGNLVGKSNDKDFLAVILLKTELSEAAIKSYYFKARFQGANKESNGPVIEIFKPKGAKLVSHYLEYEEIYFKTLESEESMDSYMVIVISDGGYENGLDIIKF